MAITALTQASGADLLDKYQQTTGQASPAQKPQAAAQVLKTAVAEAQLSEASLVSGGGADTSGALLNTYG